MSVQMGSDGEGQCGDCSGSLYICTGCLLLVLNGNSGFMTTL